MVKRIAGFIALALWILYLYSDLIQLNISKKVKEPINLPMHFVDRNHDEKHKLLASYHGMEDFNVLASGIKEIQKMTPVPRNIYYAVKLGLGTPMQEFEFFMDTGSSWSWVWADLCQAEETD